MAQMHIDAALADRLDSLESHLQAESPVLLQVVKAFRELDQVGYRVGLLRDDQSYATQVPWWPLISILGTFSAGKSTFINDTLGHKLQKSGNQAVDDKFTVVCFSPEPNGRVLPGIALDADMRFPFFKMSEQIEQVAEGEGRRIDAYLQLKTSNAEAVRGKILIDSPGFDADEQRTSTLKITDHMIDLSDLVLVFFDARHPEPGAMQDTLEHLVGKTIGRKDANKFLYILNQLDTAAGEDNPEDVVAAWQRALATQGLTAGRFYSIYSDSAARPIDDPTLAARFERKRDEDLGAIRQRMQEVGVERAYRVVAALEHQAHAIVDEDIPRLQGLLAQWRQRSGRWALGAGLGGLGTLAVVAWLGLDLLGLLAGAVVLLGPGIGVLISIGLALGLLALCAARVADSMHQKMLRNDDALAGAFARNARWWRWPVRSIMGWNGAAHQRVKDVLHSGSTFIRKLNDSFTDPSGQERSTASSTSTAGKESA